MKIVDLIVHNQGEELGGTKNKFLGTYSTFSPLVRFLYNYFLVV
jgi:hypothetical protein